MADDACFIFFSSDRRVDLGAAAVALAARGLVVKPRAEELSVSSPGKPVLRVALAAGDYVREEAEELSAGSLLHEPVSRCSARFEILIDDLNAVLAEVNTVIEVQEALVELTHGFVYRTWNGELSA
jgi:hypothetical protein